MSSRELRRASQKKGENVSETMEKRRESHPFLYGFSVVVLVVVVVTFVLAGPGGPLSRGGAGSNGSIVFGSYNGHEISYYPGSYFAQQRDAIANQIKGSSNQDQTRDNPVGLVPGLSQHRRARGHPGSGRGRGSVRQRRRAG